MSRSAIIAGTVVTTGVLAVAAVCGVALIRAGQSTPPQTTIALAPSAGAMETSMAPLPPVPSLAAPVAPVPTTESPAGPAPTPTDPVSASAAGDPSAAAVVSRRAARAAVLAQTAGSVIDVHATTHQGTPSWAVTISRRDGSVVTGFVDSIGGVVFDWTVERAARPATNTTAGTSGRHSDEPQDDTGHESDDHTGEHPDGNDD